jgi:Ni,Fe-hydrogenase I cytochrome b subunit
MLAPISESKRRRPITELQSQAGLKRSIEKLVLGNFYRQPLRVHQIAMPATKMPNRAILTMTKFEYQSKNMMKTLKQLLHTSGALTFLIAYLTSDSEAYRIIHVYCGYCFGIIFLIRIVLGLFPNSISLVAIWRRTTLGKSIYFDIKNLEIKKLVKWQRWYGALMGLIILSMYALVPPMILAGIAAYEEIGGKLTRKVMENSHEALGKLYLGIVVIHLLLIGARHLIEKYKKSNIALQPIN